MKKLNLEQLEVTSFLTSTDMKKIEGGVETVLYGDVSEAPTCVHSRVGNCLLITYNCAA